MALTTTVGGTTGGYSATGNLTSASKPTSTMTMDKHRRKNRAADKKVGEFHGLEAAVMFVEVDAGAGRIDIGAGTNRHQAIDHHPIVGMQARRARLASPSTIGPKCHRRVLRRCCLPSTVKTNFWLWSVPTAWSGISRAGYLDDPGTRARTKKPGCRTRSGLAKTPRTRNVPVVGVHTVIDKIQQALVRKAGFVAQFDFAGHLAVA